jgi:hypothetical protein
MHLPLPPAFPEGVCCLLVLECRNLPGKNPGKGAEKQTPLTRNEREAEREEKPASQARRRQRRILQYIVYNIIIYRFSVSWSSVTLRNHCSVLCGTDSTSRISSPLPLCIVYTQHSTADARLPSRSAGACPPSAPRGGDAGQRNGVPRANRILQRGRGQGRG